MAVLAVAGLASRQARRSSEDRRPGERRELPNSEHRRRDTAAARRKSEDPWPGAAGPWSAELQDSGGNLARRKTVDRCPGEPLGGKAGPGILHWQPAVSSQIHGRTLAVAPIGSAGGQVALPSSPSAPVSMSTRSADSSPSRRRARRPWTMYSVPAAHLLSGSGEACQVKRQLAPLL